MTSIENWPDTLIKKIDQDIDQKFTRYTYRIFAGYTDQKFVNDYLRDTKHKAWEFLIVLSPGVSPKIWME